MSTPARIASVLVSVVTMITLAVPTAAQDDAAISSTMPPVNLNQNIVTIVLIMGVSIALALTYALSRLIPKIRSGEVQLGKIEFDWRAELLNQPPKREKKYRADDDASPGLPTRDDRHPGEDTISGHHAALQPRVEHCGADEEEFGSVSAEDRHRRDADSPFALAMGRE